MSSSSRAPGRTPVLAGLSLVAAALQIGCGHTVWTRSVHPPDAPPARQAESGAPRYLKVHLRSGHMVLLGSWTPVAEGDSVLEGSGVRFDAARTRVDSARFAIPLDSIVLLEANTPVVRRPAGLTGLAVWSALTGATTAACVADPKSCFGSCPTFYVAGEPGDRPRAEGFSSSVARVLEASDVDMLHGIGATGRRLDVVMRNEALETHAVRRVNLLAVPRPPAGRVFATPDGAFRAAHRVVEPVACRAPEGDCLAEVRAMDGAERHSAADSTDLAAREVLELAFPPVDGPAGIVLGARQGFVTTFVFYQSIAYLGEAAGAWLAAVERGGPEAAERVTGMARVLGGVEVEVSGDARRWRPVGTYDEAGPIAPDVQVLPFHAAGGGDTLRVRLRLARGNWRLDYVALAELGAAVEAARITPRLVERDGRPDPGARERLLDSDRYLVTYPGDSYRLAFDLPRPAEELELFLESRGYYYEWMRPEWLEEEDPVMAALAVTDPAEVLRRLAAPYTRVEPLMERLFWASRFGR